MQEAREHINKLHQEKIQPHPNSKTLLASLEKDIQTAFKGSHKFIYELMQNAHDVAVTSLDLYFSAVLVEGTQYLIFSHNGKHFTKRDVNKICDNAAADEGEDDKAEGKSANQDQIGYKGIGFKAVFSVADSASIFSDNYHFRFDKNYIGWENKRCPWQIIPIWTEINALPIKIQQRLNPSRVNFIFKLKNAVNIQEELSFIANNPKNFIFLNKIKYIHVTDSYGVENCVTMQKSSITDLIDEQTISINKKLHSTWWLTTIPFDISSHVSEFLKSLDEFECPVRLKTRTSSEVTFAVPVSKNGSTIEINRQAQKDLVLFCSLPTLSLSTLPFLVNASFLLNAERSNLMDDNVWNDFLLQNIGYKQFEFLARLAKTALRYSIIHCLSDEHIPLLTSKGRDHFVTGYQQALQEIAFLPASDKQAGLLTAQAAIVDRFKFFEALAIHKPGVVDYQLKDIKSLLEKINITVFDEKALITFILNAEQLSDVEFQLKVLSFLYTHTQSNQLESQQLLVQLKNAPFLLTATQQCERPSVLFFSPPEKNYIPEALNINFVEPTLLKRLEHDPIKGWMNVQLGVQEGDVSNVLTTRGFQILQNPHEKNDGDKLVAVTLLAIQVFQEGFLDPCLDFLRKNLCLITEDDEIIPIEQAYLADVYEPEFKLEGKINKNIFVSSRYFQFEHIGANQAECIQLWREFFITLGVPYQLELKFSRRYNVMQAQKDGLYAIAEYIGQLKKNGVCPQAGVLEKSYFENFNYFPLMAHMQNDLEISRAFWKEIIRNWANIKKSSPKFITANSQRREIGQYDYIQYILQTKKVLTSTFDKDAHFNSIELYMPSFKNFENFIPVANVAVDLTPDQVVYFGFKGMLTFDDCLKVLDGLDKNNCKNMQDYTLLFQQLLQLTLTTAQQKALKAWNGRLLASDGTLEVKGNLKCFSVGKQRLPLNTPGYLKELPEISRDQLKYISTLFGIPIVAYIENFVSYTGSPKPDQVGHEEIAEYLLAMAYIVSHYTGAIVSDVYSCLTENFQRLTCYVVEGIVLNTGRTTRTISAYLDGDALYYVTSWSTRGSLPYVIRCLIKYLELAHAPAEEIENLFYYDHLSEWSKEHGIDLDKRAFDGVVTPAAVTDEDKSKNNANTTLWEMEDNIASDDDTDNCLDLYNEIASSTSTSTSAPPTTTAAETPSMVFNTPMAKFSLKGKLSDTDLKKVSMHKAKLTPFKASGSHKTPAKMVLNKQKATLSDAEKHEIGRAGEEMVYAKLREHYANKYGTQGYKLEDTATGFQVVNDKVAEEVPYLEVVWHNKETESYAPRDFTIQKNKVERIVEVKSTPSPNKYSFDVSANEYEQLQKYGDRYRFFRVRGVGTQQEPVIDKIKNPSDALEKNMLKIKSYVFKYKSQQRTSTPGTPVMEQGKIFPNKSSQ